MRPAHVATSDRLFRRFLRLVVRKYRNVSNTQPHNEHARWTPKLMFLQSIVSFLPVTHLYSARVATNYITQVCEIKSRSASKFLSMKVTRQVSYVFRRSASLFKYKYFRFIQGGSCIYTKFSPELHSPHMARQQVTKWCGCGLHFRSRVDYRIYLFTPLVRPLTFLYTDKKANPLRNLYTPQAKFISINGLLTQLATVFPQDKSICPKICQTHQITVLLDFKTVAQDGGKFVNP